MNVIKSFFIIIAVILSLPAEEIVSASTLTSWGYRRVSSSFVNRSEWHRETFGEAVLYRERIKSIDPVEKGSRTFYRFTLTKESYLNNEAAEKRVESLKRAVPPGVNTKKSPELLLCEGFAFNNRVYIVSTDVMLFSVEELPRLVEYLKNEILEKQ